MRISMAFLISLIATSASAAEDKPRWIGSAVQEGASLLYGLPNTGDVQLSFSCGRKGEVLEFSFDHEPRSAKNGMKVALSLSANGVEIKIPTVGERMEMDDQFVLSGRIPLDDRLKKLLTSNGILKVRARKRSIEFPLAGVAEAARPLLERCG